LITERNLGIDFFLISIFLRVSSVGFQ